MGGGHASHEPQSGLAAARRCIDARSAKKHALVWYSESGCRVEYYIRGGVCAHPYTRPYTSVSSIVRSLRMCMVWKEKSEKSTRAVEREYRRQQSPTLESDVYPATSRVQEHDVVRKRLNGGRGRCAVSEAPSPARSTNESAARSTESNRHIPAPPA
ncbi:hypothetical protein BV25DRAFT_943419 [Artomyces pyxidatus]|uniref:Uncharacterized protein n=1 Tax=Artomyces pyxidatus TaxID=48021 RepID=A0ACB8SVS1_9AGAM|nr:hypothetical protein BV25DRAFT_943419 [Artomyces pyxidatus]